MSPTSRIGRTRLAAGSNSNGQRNGLSFRGPETEERGSVAFPSCPRWRTSSGQSSARTLRPFRRCRSRQSRFCRRGSAARGRDAADRCRIICFPPSPNSSSGSSRRRGVRTVISEISPGRYQWAQAPSRATGHQERHEANQSVQRLEPQHVLLVIVDFEQLSVGALRTKSRQQMTPHDELAQQGRVLFALLFASEAARRETIGSETIPGKNNVGVTTGATNFPRTRSPAQTHDDARISASHPFRIFTISAEARCLSDM